MGSRDKDKIAALLEQLGARAALKEKRGELLRKADHWRAEIARKEKEAAAVDTRQQAAEDQARASVATGDAEAAAEARAEADVLAGQVHGFGGELRTMQAELAAAQAEAVGVAEDIKALDRTRDAIHNDMELRDALAPWSAHKQAIEDAALKALRVFWPKLEAEAHRLAPVLHDRRRVDRATWRAGRCGGVDIYPIVVDAAKAAVGRYLVEHEIEKLPRLEGSDHVLYRIPGVKVEKL